ncbi:MAG: glutathione S-transferase family protein [Maricaulaceae bacterium]|jgi:glutathione S-transferase
MNITLYEYPGSRSQRVRWMLDELGVEFTSYAGREVFEMPAFHAASPHGRVPAVEIDGEPLIESAAICTYLADLYPEKGLIPATGTVERARHDQWVCFVLTELEAYLWIIHSNTKRYKGDRQVREIIPQAEHEARRALKLLEAHLSNQDYLLGDAFQVTDLIAGFAVNWADGYNLLDKFPALTAYLDRLYARPACGLKKADG